MTTSWTETDQSEIRRWAKTVKVAIIPAVTKSKELHVTDWQELDASKIDYDSNIQSGIYDHGIAIRAGKTLDGLYLIVLDFDGWDAVQAWFGSWENVLEAARRTRIEWHGDKTRLHYFVLADSPVPNRKIHIKDSLLEIRCERQAVFVSPSVHKDGEKYRPIDSPVVAKLVELQLMNLQSNINTLCDGYMSDEDRQKYLEYLHLPTTIIGEHQGRHDATKTIINNYYWKYGGGWLDISDEERFERAWEWHISHCKPPRTREEFDKLCKWAADKFKIDRDRLHNEKREERARLESELSNMSEAKLRLFKSYPSEVAAHLANNIWSETNKDNWIVADTNENIIYKCFSKEIEGHSEDTGKDYEFTIFCKADRILKCIPISITKHEDPFDSSQTTYTIVFRNTLHKKYSQARLTIDEISEWLKNEGYILPVSNRGGSVTQILSAMIDAFREDCRLQIERSAHFEGYYFDAELNDLQINKIDLAEKHPRHTVEECISCADFLEKRSEFSVYLYNDKQIDRRDVLATCIKWTVISPFNFLLKQITGRYLKAIAHYGERDGGKTSMSDEMLDIHGHHNDKRLGEQSIYNLDAGSMNTEAKFGKCVDKTTYLVTASEFGNIESYGRNERLAETIKNAIESVHCRRGKKGSSYDSPFYAASPIVFNGNPVITNKGELRKRIHSIVYTQEDRHNPEDARTIEFNEFMSKRRHEYKVLGDWVINYLIDNKSELLLSGKYDQYKLMDIVIKAFYDSIGQQVPEWLTKWITDNSLEELDVDETSIIRAVLFRHIHDVLRQSSSLISKFDIDSGDKDSQSTSLEKRIELCLDNNLLSFVRQVPGNTDKFEIDSSIKMLLKDHLSNLTLKKIGEKMGFDHERNVNGGYVLKFTKSQLTDFIKGVTN